MPKTCYILRGLPGAGKSSLAKILASSFRSIICSADNYFINEQGQYVFNRELLAQAHCACLGNAKQAMFQGIPCVIIDNTNTLLAETYDYIDMARENGYQVIQLVVENVNQTESIHNVPENTLLRMKQRFQYVSQEF